MSGDFGKGFHLDGAINSGNSGGPVIDIESGKVYGIVTAKRYMSPNHLDQLESQWMQLQDHDNPWQLIAGGVDMFSIYPLMAESIKVLKDMLEANASTGIGHLQPIGWALGELIDNELSYTS